MYYDIANAEADIVECDKATHMRGKRSGIADVLDMITSIQEITVKEED